MGKNEIYLATSPALLNSSVQNCVKCQIKGGHTGISQGVRLCHVRNYSFDFSECSDTESDSQDEISSFFEITAASGCSFFLLDRNAFMV